MCVLLRVVDEKQIPVSSQNSHALFCKSDVPPHIIVPRRSELAPVVSHSDVVVRISVNHIYAVVGQVAQDAHYIVVDDAIAVFFGKCRHSLSNLTFKESVLGVSY